MLVELLNQLIREFNKITRLLRLDIEGQVKARKEARHEWAAIHAKLDALSRDVSGVSGNVIRTQKEVEKLTPMVEAAVAFLLEHPDYIDMPSRQVAKEDDVDYSHPTIYRAQKHIKEQIQQ